MDWVETKAFLGPCFPEEVRAELALLEPGELREIRVRANRPAILVTATRTAVLDWHPAQEEVEQVAEALAEHGLYARSSEMSRGFVTLRGGHRLGLCGQVSCGVGQTQSLQQIGSLNLRIAAEWPGTADALMPWVRRKEAVGSALIVGLPGTGKTTLLRDLARQLASGKDAVNVALVDERGELAACVDGAAQLDVGVQTDVLEGCAKPDAMAWLIRSMSPRAIVTDELADGVDASAVLEAVYAGIPVLASAHGAGLHEIAQRPALAALMARRVFDVYAVLADDGSGKVAALYDRSGSTLPVS